MIHEPEWVTHALWWQLYPLGFVGAFPQKTPSATPATPAGHRLDRVLPWLDHAIELGASGLALGPVFDSSTHGYDTLDYLRIDPRLGDEDDFDRLITAAHARGLRVMLDGVFNHVSARHPRYLAALRDGPQSEAAAWFRRVDQGYQTFEGHPGLITLNHDHPEVQEYIVEVMCHWLERGADAWRLDAAYAVPARFWAAALPRVRERFPEAWFVGEVIHGDYIEAVVAGQLDSVTQYELWKAIWSSLNDRNFHELDWTLQRHNALLDAFVPATFIGNHDVTRIASRLEDARHLAHALVILLTVGGTPSIYAGDEYRFEGIKEERLGGDDVIRPEFPAPEDVTQSPEASAIFRLYQELVGLRRRHPWLHRATTEALHLTSDQYVYRVSSTGRALLVALNLADQALELELAGVTIQASAHGWAVIDVPSPVASV
ncbi:alpha-amylase family protein [Psychromicrobium xiongbiense]|uniref:alpha-amylase family protein n=1 Tax=Psychromicrobium xiongbiense TaxID=3051184 RepID=UPI00255499EE|nr:alpha-amylase family protein [Psychromicrobium sp. YIM S02556]